MDDTLYEEITFVQSGFRAVAAYLAGIGITTAAQDEIYDFMWKQLSLNGRGQVFNDALLYFSGEMSDDLVRACIEQYRYHEPNIQLPQSTIQVIESLNQYPLYVVTDGYADTQERKITALGLNQYVKEAIASYREGTDKGKPSPYWFNKIAEIEEVKPEQIVYIGDNPSKDFVGIKPLGFRTIRIQQGPYANHVPSIEHEAEVVIEWISELATALKRLWPNIEVRGD